ncbi:MAG: hypothetical protein IT441_06615 [Phycisphaeraceae bacterium]|nr:hypothetical protein [Phycisphaeraceae bacterium]
MKRVVMTALIVGLSAWLTQTALGHPSTCTLCHTPHAAYSDTSVPLWQPDHSTTTLTGNYSSPTMDAVISESPDGASKLCLSCHDGSYSSSYGPITAHPEVVFGPAGDLGGMDRNHPVSFVYDAALVAADPELVDPSTLAKDILDRNEKMQCTSCHDIHNNTAAVDTPNLRWAYDPAVRGTVSAFCRQCHAK